MLLIDFSKKALQKVRDLKQVYYICYAILFEKDLDKIKIMLLIDFKSKKNTRNLTYTAKLDNQL